MRIGFRADASYRIGTGHIVRCMTLAGELVERGHQVFFVSRRIPGNLNDAVRRMGYEVLEPGLPEKGAPLVRMERDHTRGDDSLDWREDALQTASLLSRIKPEWLIVDHYDLDEDWEAEISGSFGRLLVIDDLANRPHQCDMLLDQNLGSDQDDYDGLVDEATELLVGAKYALLREEFAKWRTVVEQPPVDASSFRILITMGGGDSENVTGRVLTVLESVSVTSGFEIVVVLGKNAKHVESVKAVASRLAVPVEVKQGINNMAETMARCHFAITAGGSTTLELCCMGLPSLIVTLAENQVKSANAMDRYGAALLIGWPEDIEMNLPRLLSVIRSRDVFARMREKALMVTDGLGVKRVADRVESKG